MKVLLEDWYDKVKAGDYSSAKTLLDPAITSSKTILKQPKPSANKARDNALVNGILYRGLQNFTDLLQTVQTADWLGNPKLVEKAWDGFLDSRDRITYAAGHFESEEIRWALAKLADIGKEFLENFGPGLYCSPEIVCKREVCCVCRNDFRSCEHIRGEIYDGVRCRTTPDGVEIRASAIVPIPADPRCRIWPWQLKEKDGEQVIEGVCVLTAFSLDDFLNDD